MQKEGKQSVKIDKKFVRILASAYCRMGRIPLAMDFRRQGVFPDGNLSAEIFPLGFGPRHNGEGNDVMYSCKITTATHALRKFLTALTG